MFGANSVLQTIFGTKYDLQVVGEHCVFRNFMNLRPTFTKYWGGSFTGDPEGYVKGGSGNGHLSPEGPRWGTWRGGSFTGDIEIE